MSSVFCSGRNGSIGKGVSPPFLGGNIRVRLVIAALVLALVCFTLPFSPSYAETTIRVGIYENKPKVFTDDPGRPAGIFVDIIEAVAASEGWQIEYVRGTWSEGLDRLAAGEIDLMPDVAYTAEREKRFSFHSEPVLSDWFQVYAIKGSGITSILDLDGKRVSVLERSIQEEAFGRLVEGFDLDVDTVPFPDYASAFLSVREGKVDAVITNRFYGVMHLGNSGLEDTAVIFNPTRLFFAASKGVSPSFLATLDDRLAEMKHEPGSAYFQSLKRWTSETYQRQFPVWMKVFAAALAAVAVIGVAGTLVFRHQVRVRSLELVRSMEARVAAETADHMKSAFLATMSHELRTPLNSIIGFTGILIQGLAGPLNAEQKKQLTMVQGSARHLLALINDVLDVSKIEAGRLVLEKELFSPVDSAGEVIERVRPLAEKKGIFLRHEAARERHEILGDRRRFDQILLNLLNNAVKFTASGGVTVRSSVDDRGLLFSVADTGIGIEAKDLEQIFEPFKQLDTGKTRQYEGTGLGLSISRKLAEAMGGSLGAESRPGEGSIFTLRLPLKRSEEE